MLYLLPRQLIRHQLFHYLGWVHLLFWFSFSYPVSAQISPDNTLSTQVQQSGNQFTITGGATVGNNLFHSFEEFSLPTNAEAFFNNTANISNIFTRVTGNSISNIDGILSTNGEASLFLLNPKGIIFGANAELNIGGSFIATTADTIVFIDGTEFSTQDNQNPPLLTINMPLGLQFGNNPGQIINRSQVTPEGRTSILGEPIGLEVQSDNTLALIGGEIILESGYISGVGSTIELGSVSSHSLVNLIPDSQGWLVSYEGVTDFEDISFVNLSLINNSGSGSEISLQGRQISLTGISQILNSAVGEEDAGTLKVTATELVELSDNSALVSQVGLTPDSVVTGNGGELIVETGRLVLRDVSFITSGTLSQGNAGNITINATESIELAGTDTFNVGGAELIFRTTVTTSSQGTGNGGELTINTGRLIVKDGAQIQAATFPNFTGAPADGAGGTININADDVIVDNVAGISVNSLGNGEAGELNLRANSLLLDNQGSITASTVSSDGGNLNLNVQGAVSILGNSAISAAAGGLGNGGNIDIDADTVNVLQNSLISANAFQGNGGNILINTQGLFIAPGSSISASSQLGVDGLVQINNPDVEVDGGLIDLPENVTDISKLITRGCGTSNNNQFVVTGKGGIPTDPYEIFRDRVIWQDWRNLSVSTSANHNSQAMVENQQPAIVEATGIIIHEDGRVELAVIEEKINPSTNFSHLNCSSN